MPSQVADHYYSLIQKAFGLLYNEALEECARFIKLGFDFAVLECLRVKLMRDLSRVTGFAGNPFNDFGTGERPRCASVSTPVSRRGSTSCRFGR